MGSGPLRSNQNEKPNRGSSPGQRRRLNILHVEDNADEVALTRHLLSKDEDIQFDIKNAQGLNAAAQHLNRITYDAMLLDLNLGDGEGVMYPDESIFCDRLAHTIAQARANPRQFAVLSLELDHLDVLANLAGRSLRSEMIETAYLHLRDRISATDTLARVGESSFALILDDVASSTSVSEIAQALSGCVSSASVKGEDISVGVESIGMTASIGVAMYPDDGRDLEALREGADQAQQIASEVGGSAVQFCRDLELYQDYLEKSVR